LIVLTALVLVVFACGQVQATKQVASPAYDAGHERWPTTVFWFDDIEGDVSGWSTVDFTAIAVPHFHVDSYMGYQGTNSWWCGTFDYDVDGGYGNSWDDRLVIPTTDLSTATYPILTYAFRHDSEIGYDYTYVQAESGGVYVDLNRGYDGPAPWTDLGLYGFILGAYDNPLNARFRFISDGAWSDEDGDYLSVGGAFMCDIVKVFDYFGGAVYFFDNADDQVHMIPAVGDAAGDWWHIIDRACPAASRPHSWWCGDDSDTNLIPPALQNSLRTPIISVYAEACTVQMYVHFAVPTVDNDYCEFKAYCNGDYYHMYSYWGDFESCDGWGSSGIAGYDVGQFGTPPITEVGYEWIMNTTDNGCGPAVNGPAGVYVDHVTFYGVPYPNPVEDSSWGNIKALYR
jgi:hypothetical protein